MGYKLKTWKVEENLSMSEKACENYKCCSCGEKMISANFVNGICIQVFVSHGEGCQCFIGNAFRRTVEVTCETCSYFNRDQTACTYDGKCDHRIESVRTMAQGGV